MTSEQMWDFISKNQDMKFSELSGKLGLTVEQARSLAVLWSTGEEDGFHIMANKFKNTKNEKDNFLSNDYDVSNIVHGSNPTQEVNGAT